ncbi:hypothetical protein ENUP19_0098G0019 [Entamoeba nuttalli]|uniref:Leucine rich repeat protein, BspA family protein n=1 Tax=Entamoeba nuttalli TaxID=412467 RepID=A0ABQ0DH83_9EUKA
MLHILVIIVFSNCTRLREIQMNKDIGYVVKCSFWNCKRIVKIRSSMKIHKYQSIQYWIEKSIEMKYQEKSREYEMGCQIEEISIPSNVIDIGNECFAYCNKLTNIKLHEGIKEIPKGFMKYCGQIERVQLQQSITKISTESFKECIKLKEINNNQNKMINEK